MAYEKTTWVDGKTEIDAQKLNKMEEGIEEAGKTGGILEGTIVAYDGDTIPEGYEEVDNPNVYSTQEKVIGEWINGKPIYRKVVNIPSSAFGTGTATEGGSISIAHNINNLDILLRIDCNWERGSGKQKRAFPSVYWSSGSWNGQVYTNQTTMFFEMGKDLLNNIRSAVYVYAILEYTKTTD